MRFISKLRLLLVVLAVFALAPSAQAQRTGSCRASVGEAYLDINQVRARILNNGSLFYRGEPHVYEVPKGGGANAIFASGFWIAGQVGGQLRAAGTTYGPYEFWAGPIDDAGNAPADCGLYDKVWKVSKLDVKRYEAGEGATPDLSSWPTGLGAPTLDADGNLIDVLDQPLSTRRTRVIDLAGGERPMITGDQMLWWIMNDLGNTHGTTETPPIGLEVHGSAFAFNLPGALGNTTFYRYRLFYKGAAQPLTNTYVSLFSDPDLGDAFDDYVGSDSTNGIGYVYNADNLDSDYGEAPPAVGYDFFQGPLVPGEATDTALQGGQKIPGFRNLDMTSFVYYNNGSGINEDPQVGADYYNYMQARWKDGRRIQEGGDGLTGTNGRPANFMFPGDPVQSRFWSEVNSDGNGTAIEPNDRRFVMSSGPFTIQPGDYQEIVFGIVWSRGASNLDSITRLRADDRFAQAAFDVNFELPAPPDAPTLTAEALNNRIILQWENAPNSNNYLNSYEELDPLAPEEDNDYIFEGYEVIQYESARDNEGRVIATYDEPNGITRVLEQPAPGEPSVITADGEDRGVQTFHIVDAVTNYKSYYFAVRGYAYNELSGQKVYPGPISNRVEVTPAPPRSISEEGIAALEGGTATSDFDVETGENNLGQGVVKVDVVNPIAVMPGSYRVEFLESEGAITYNIVHVDTTGTRTVKFNGVTYVADRGEGAPQRNNVVVVDGLQFSITGPQPGFGRFLTVSNANGAINPPTMGAFAFNANGFPTLDGGAAACGDQSTVTACNDRPTTNQQVSGARFGIHVGGSADGTFETYLSRSVFGRAGNTNGENLGSYDYEWRFTGESIAYRAFDSDDPLYMTVPFELWNIGIGTPDDPSDDYRMIPFVCETACRGSANQTVGVFDIGGDHPVSGGDNDPLSDWVYWYNPEDTTPGQAGYNAYAADITGADPQGLWGAEVMARQVVVGFNLGSAAPYTPAALPEPGTVFRIVTLKPNQPGDVFAIDTRSIAAPALTQADRVAQLDRMGISPNPYRGASTYETSQLVDEVRFTGLPEGTVNIKVFTLNGTLIYEDQKVGPEATRTWDLTTTQGLPIASGMYLIHVDVEGVGERVLKFGVVKKRTQLNVF